MARTGFLNYITSAYKEIRTLESCPPSAQSGRHNISAVSGGTVSKTKIEHVERYADQTVSDMQTMIDQLDQLTLESPETQLEFRQLQDRMKTTSKEVETTKRNAKELIDQAIDCDLGAESTRMEAVYRELEKKEINLLRSVQELKDDYGIVGDIKCNDLKYPMFSGEQTDKLDYFTFKEDWEACLAVKGPSKAEQLRLLTHQCLTGSAGKACQQMESVGMIFAHLKVAFGNVSDLFAQRVEEIRRLGLCTGSNDKKRKWVIEVNSQLIYLKDIAKKHGMYEDLYTHPVVAHIQESLPPDIFKKFLEKIRERAGRASKEEVFDMLLDYMTEILAIFNHDHSYKLDHGVDTDN